MPGGDQTYPWPQSSGFRQGIGGTSSVKLAAPKRLSGAKMPKNLRGPDLVRLDPVSFQQLPHRVRRPLAGLTRRQYLPAQVPLTCRRGRTQRGK